MNLKQLEAFVEVVESRSFSKAAKSLYLTQPTISAHISSLEKELNAKLLIRNTKEVYPSEKGEMLYGYARKMVDLENAVYQKFNLAIRNQKNVIVLAASTIPAQYILPQILADFSSECPEEQFRLIESDSAGVIKMVTNHEAEIGLSGTKLASSSCEFLPFYKDKLVVITPNLPKYEAMKETGFSLEALMKEPLLMREEGSGTRKEAEEYIRQAGGRPGNMNVIASISNQETIKKSVSNGMGISIISEVAARDYVTEGRVLTFDLLEGSIYRDLYIVRNKNFELSASGMKFYRHVKKYFQPEV